jgi:hypothetical protein
MIEVIIGIAPIAVHHNHSARYGFVAREWQGAEVAQLATT